ncbi:hypothetical protein F4804DRAFT_353342 [Jackrogersella minutella]|nr:hypothetical protein F4804DRAFT_353342 [Jackrogersella minutella]
MSEGSAPCEASGPGQMSNDPTDANSRATLSPIDLIQPLKDSQDTDFTHSAQESTAEQPCQDSRSIPPIGVNLFTRPTIETAEEIGAAFQYQPPPPRIAPLPPSRQQKTQVTSSLSIPKKPSGRVSDSETTELNNLNKKQGFPPPNSHMNETGEHTSKPQKANPVDVIIPLQEAPRDDAQYTQVPAHNIPKATGDGNAYGLPFPDDNLDEIDLSYSERKRHNSPYAPLANARLPKSFSETRRKALAKMSPHSRSPRENISQSSSIASDRPLVHISRTTTKRGVPENRQHSSMYRPASITSAALENSHGEGVEHVSSKRRPSGRQKGKDIIRPVRSNSPVDELLSMVRPCSQASNISKPRAPRKMQYQQPTPTREQNSLNLMKFAKSWNTNYLYNQKLLDRWEQKMKMLEEHIAEQDTVIEQYQKDIEFRDQTIDELSIKEEELRAQNHKVQDEITTSTNARKKLEDKLRACRNRLNDAINEQQRLFKQCKENCENAIAKISTDGHLHKESIEKASGTLELVRAEVKQKIAAVIKDTNGQVESLNKTIKSLEAQLNGREKELERERQHAMDLNNQLADFHKLNEQSIQSVATQNLELLEKMKQDREQATNTEICIRKQDDKINAILKVLEETRLKAADPKALIEKIEGMQNDTVAKVVAGVQDSIESHQNSMLADQEIINENLGGIHVLCEGICERMTCADDVSKWQERAHDANMAIHTQIQQIQELQDDVHQMYIRNNEESEERVELKSQLAGLQNAATNEQAANEKVRGLTEEVGRLQRMLDDKETKLTKSNEDLEALREELRTQARILQDKEEQIRNEHEQHQKVIELTVQKHEEGLFQTVTEATKELGGQLQATEKRLEEANTVRAQLAQELADLKQELDISNKANIDEDVRQIRGELVAAITPMTKLAIDLQELDHEREILQGSLEKWSCDRNDIYQMRDLLRRLARDQPNAIQMSDQLKELLEIQKRLSGTLEYHRAGLAGSEAAVTSIQSQQNGETVARSEHISDLTSDLQNDADHLQEKLQSLNRKVVVKSPVTEDDYTSPMSVEEERSTRRHSLPPRGIMKVSNDSTSRESEKDGNVPDIDFQKPAVSQPPPNRRIAKRGSKPLLTTHSLYNRPVAGSVLEMSTGQVDASQAGSNGYKNNATMDSIASGSGSSDRTADSFYDIIDEDDVDEPPVKRPRINGVGQQQSQGLPVTQRVKVSQLMTTHISTQKPKDLQRTEELSSESRTLPLRGGPLQRRPSGLLTYGSQSSGMKRSLSQSSAISTAMKSTEGRLSLTCS